MGEPFRDEHTALLERIARLEDDLATERGDGAKHDDLARELDELTKRVARALERTNTDREALADVSQALDRVRRKVAPAAEAPSAPSEEPRTPNTAASSRTLSLVIVGVFALVAVVFFSRRKQSPPAIETPATLDATAVVEEARKYAIDQGLPATGRLVRIKAQYASSDGLVHLREPTYEASVELVFVAPLESPRAASPAPLGARSDLFEIQTESSVVFARSGVRVTGTQSVGDVSVPNPRCTVADVWKAARAEGAPANAVATLTYEEGVVITANASVDRAPHWHFEIASTRYTYDISDSDCTVIR
jgi:hypothetical protein